MKRLLCLLLLICLPAVPASAAPIRWVELHAPV